MPKFLVPLCSAALLSFLPLATKAAPQPPSASTTPSATPAGPSASSSAPASAPTLTLSVAIERALSAHPRLRAAAFEVEAADGAVQQAALPPNPSLGVEQEDTRRETRTVTVLLSQPLEIGGQRAARTALARRGRDISQAELDA
ncbi:TolC family protein, partial [Roseateles sp.]|uniref:TolC family protein n=1 Tax=Roseateles sp. TaxID=1971397 RepID=UPI002F404753